ncbi:MAG TPA: D-alanine--D-alanine ligase family protein [Candidatus Limnocylindrales bacterium]
MTSVAGAGLPVVVLFGGPSAEHDVSIVSGTAIAQGLVAAGLSVRRVLIDLDGAWWWLPPDATDAGRPAADYDDPVALGAEGPYSAGAAVDRLAARVPRPAVFVALHGPFGEDGTVQALLESADLAYTGAGVTASAVGMDKAVFKRLARGLGLPVVDWREVPAAAWATDPDPVLAELAAFAAETGDERLMVKPARLGSSVGMTLAHRAGERSGALATAFAHDSLAIVERYLDHPRELEVGVLGNDPAVLEVFGPGEVFPGREFYDYAAKYTDPTSRVTVRAELPAALGERIRELALAAYRAIGGEGLARVDFLAPRSDGPEAVYLSEINTIPGFTPISLFPQLAVAAGHPFPELCATIVRLGLERHAARVRRHLGPADLPRA